MIKRVLLCLLTFIIFVCSLSSCSRDNEAVYVLKYGNTSISEGMYRYLYASLKQYYLDTYGFDDTSDEWKESVDGKTYAEIINEKIRETINVFAISAELFDSRGGSIDSEGRALISAEVQAAVDRFGSEEELEEALERDFGMTGEELRKAHEIQYKYEKLLYDSGAVQADDESREEYYKEKYIRVKLIYIFTEIGYKTDEDGKYIINGTEFETYELTEAEKAEKIAKIDEIQSGLADGSLTFDEAYANSELNELDTVNYPNGLYFGEDNYTESGFVEVAQIAFAMDIGEVKRIEYEKGELLICRYDLPDSAYDSAEDYTQFSDLDELCAKYQFDKWMQELMPGVDVNEEVVEKYSVTNVSPVSY